MIPGIIDLAQIEGVKMNRKHKWKPAGVCENKYCEARCDLCGRHEPNIILSADWCDGNGIDRFWKELNTLRDCPGSRK